MARKVAQFAAELADREAIRDCMARYSRGADRIDQEAMLGAYWPDATDDHGGIYEGPASGLVEQMVPLLRGLDYTSHILGNCLIEISGDKSRAETYVLAIYRLTDPNANAFHIIVGARYLDQFSKRDDEWRLCHRHLVIDWSNTIAGASEEPAALVQYAMLGGRLPNDPSNGFFSTEP